MNIGNSISGITAAACAGLVLTVACATDAMAAPPISQYKNRATDLCLDSDTAGYTYTKSCGRDNSYQHWYRYDSNGAIQLQNRVSGKCLTATSTESVYAKSCNNGDSAQWWTEEYVTDGVVMLINQKNRMALDSDGRGNAYLKSPGSGNTYQEWKSLQ
ncbi:RICIN domain-containing protein [Streptomyces chrestomyceticus]|uniref:RICIN domain-containing protein n=1 Tax=Streptomyces chrestomyceticus TaxID=68185 RepID=UPI0037BA5282